MKNRFVADGPERLASSEEFQARCEALRIAVYAKYADRMAEARFFQRLLIRYERYRDYKRALDELSPSPQSLWLNSRLGELSRKKGAETRA